MPNMMSQMTLEMKPGGILFFGSVFWPLKKTPLIGLIEVL